MTKRISNASTFVICIVAVLMVQAQTTRDSAESRKNNLQNHSGPPANNLPWSADAVLYDKAIPHGSLQFQFLIGNWDIVAKRYDPTTGTLLSEINVLQHVEYRNDKRMVVEEWTGFSPVTGQKIRYGISLRTYSEETGQWEVVFLASHQPYPASVYSIRQIGNEMIGEGEFYSPSAGVVKFRTRFFNITEESYEWEQKYSVDGENWFLERTQSARRK